MPTPKELHATKIFDASLREQNLVSQAKAIADAKLEKQLEEQREQFFKHSPRDEEEFNKQWKNCKKMFALLVIAGVRADDIKLTLTDKNSFQFSMENPLAGEKRHGANQKAEEQELKKFFGVSDYAYRETIIPATDDEIAYIANIIGKTPVEIGDQQLERKNLLGRPLVADSKTSDPMLEERVKAGRKEAVREAEQVREQARKEAVYRAEKAKEAAVEAAQAGAKEDMKNLITESPSTSPQPTSCVSFLEFIATKFTNLIDRISGNPSKEKSNTSLHGSEKTPSPHCEPKGFMQLAGEMLKGLKSILSH